MLPQEIELDDSALKEARSKPLAQIKLTWAMLTSLSSVCWHFGLEQICTLSAKVLGVSSQHLAHR